MMPVAGTLPSLRESARRKLKTHQQQEIMHLVSSGQKTAADAARLFNVHPATVSRLLQVTGGLNRVLRSITP